MDLKDKLVSSFLAFEQKVDIDSALHNIRNEALKVFENKGFPTKKEEAWKYTSLNSVLEHDYNILPKNESALEWKDVKKFFLNDVDTYKVVFVNGVFSSNLSSTTHDGLDVCLMSSALTKPKYKMVIDTYFNQVANKEDSLTNLNTAYAFEGAYIKIPKSTVVQKPIEILYFTTGTSSNLVQPSNLVIVGENAQGQIIKRHQSLTDTAMYTNSVTENYATKPTIVNYYKLQNDLLTTNLVDNTYIEQKQ